MRMKRSPLNLGISIVVVILAPAHPDRQSCRTTCDRKSILQCRFATFRPRHINFKAALSC